MHVSQKRICNKGKKISPGVPTSICNFEGVEILFQFQNCLIFPLTCN